ncbi:hypothetical protein [Halobacteriovorax sp. HLS]|uniref:hypothetical protein n=1 Tax=Halobacteriovorax sp. HLS TaxID=2234000 RepID=UPI000FD7A44C|nr:hypothetical protein [Halobacteriovorax sp. HLS]
MKLLKYLFLIALFASSTSSLARPDKSSHELFELNVGIGDLDYLPEVKITAIDLYESPSLKARVIQSVPLKNPDGSNTPGYYAIDFDDKSGVFWHQGIYSKEKSGDFYKVFYKGSYYWAHKKSFMWITKIEDKFIGGMVFLAADKLTFYESPGGKVFNKPKSMLDYIDKSPNKDNYLEFKAVAYKWIDSKLWIQFEEEKESCGIKNYTFKKKNVKFWVHPYDKNGKPFDEKGKPFYIYSYKGC